MVDWESQQKIGRTTLNQYDGWIWGRKIREGQLIHKLSPPLLKDSHKQPRRQTFHFDLQPDVQRLQNMFTSNSLHTGGSKCINNSFDLLSFLTGWSSSFS